MATVKNTQKDFFKAAIKFFNGEDIDFSNDEMIEFFEGRIAVLEKKSANRKTKVNESDEALKETTLDILANGEKMTVTAIMQAGNFPDGTSNQKVSAILRKLIAEGLVEKEKDKKTTLFSAVAAE